MSTLSVELYHQAHNVICTDASLVVELVDGRTISEPLLSGFRDSHRQVKSSLITVNCWGKVKASIGLMSMKTSVLLVCWPVRNSKFPVKSRNSKVKS